MKITIEGTRPLLMHNGQMKDPLNKYAKALAVLTGNKKKTEADHHAIARAEFLGSLYFDDKIGPMLPIDVLQAAMQEGAAKRKKATEFKALVEIVDKPEQGYKLDYVGPRAVDALFTKEFYLRKPAGVQGKSVIRTRPRFPVGWSCTLEVERLDDGAPSEDQIVQAFRDCGRLVGIGDWTPKYGRFVVK
jgi:hypothetical protein